MGRNLREERGANAKIVEEFEAGKRAAPNMNKGELQKAVAGAG